MACGAEGFSVQSTYSGMGSQDHLFFPLLPPISLRIDYGCSMFAFS